MKLWDVRYVIGIFLAVLAANLVIYTTQPFGDAFPLIAGAIAPLLSFLAAVAGIYTFRVHGTDSAQGKSVFLLTAGIFFWFLGELAWFLYDTFSEVPALSVADAAWFAGYALFFAGLYSIIKSVGYIRFSLLLPVVIAIVVSTFIFTYMVAPVISDPEIAPAEKISGAGYVIADMFLFAFIAVTAACLLDTKFRKVWWIILLGLLTIAVADAYYAVVADYSTGDFIDILWNMGYALIGLGFFYHLKTVYEIVDSAGIRKKRR